MFRFLVLVIGCHLSFCSILLGQAASIDEGNWPQWRGPNANGTATAAADPPLTWDESTHIKWKVAIAGEGSSTPIVWEDNVFLLSAVITDRTPPQPPDADPDARTEPPANIVSFVVWNLDRHTGVVKWKREVHEQAPHEGRHPSTTYAAASPVTDGKHLFASFGSYGVYCLDFSGNLVWKQNLGSLRTRRGWGEGVSPALHGNRLIVNGDQEDQSRISVLDVENGSIVWQLSRDEPTTWSTPLVMEHAGRTQVITNGTNRIRSYDLSDGSLIWEAAGTTLNAIPSPVSDGEHVVCMAGYQGNAAVSIPISSQGNVDAQVDWKVSQHTPYVPSPLLTQGRLYFTKSNNAILTCLDVATGRPVYPLQRLPGLENLYASPVATADRIYFVSREGVTLVIANSPEFKVLATNKIQDGIDASPAIAGKQIFLRSKTHVYCIEQ